MKHTASKIAVTFFFTCQPTFSADMLLFDNPALTVIQQDDEIRGHYVGRSNKSNFLGSVNFPITCEFLFTEFYRTSDALQISAWENSIFMPDDPYLTYGLIRIHDDTWKIIFEGIPRGCRSKEDSDKLTVKASPCCNPADLAERGGLYVKPTQHIRAIGFRILNKGHALIKIDSDRSTQSTHKIERGTIVMALRIKRNNAYVRHVIPETGEVVHGWVSNDALVDPFKKSTNTKK